MTEVSETVEEKIEFKPGRDLQQRPVVDVFLESDRPYLTRRQVQAALKGNHSRGTVIDRLTELTEVGVLKHDDLKGGGIYWLNNDKSDWPIPPDVEVEPRSDERTISEFFALQSVRTSVLGIGGILLSSILIWLGGSFAAAGISHPYFQPSDLIAFGLLTTLLGWVLFGYGVFTYFKESNI